MTLRTRLDFVQTRQVLDAQMKQLTTTGVGAVKKQAQPLTPEQEDSLWKQGILSIETAQGLLNAMFWYNCVLGFVVATNTEVYN